MDISIFETSFWTTHPEMRFAADLDTASINTTGGNEMTTDASDTTISTSYKTTTLGKHLYAVEKTVTTLGSVTADSDGLTGTTGGSKSAGSQLT